MTWRHTGVCCKRFPWVTSTSVSTLRDDLAAAELAESAWRDRACDATKCDATKMLLGRFEIGKSQTYFQVKKTCHQFFLGVDSQHLLNPVLMNHESHVLKSFFASFPSMIVMTFSMYGPFLAPNPEDWLLVESSIKWVKKPIDLGCFFLST